MTKKEFIQQLRRSLSGRLDSTVISEHAEYYEEYIEILVRKGQEEEKVVEELGSPALLAKSILNADYDSRHRFNNTTLLSLGTRMRSLCLALGRKAGERMKGWFESLK